MFFVDDAALLRLGNIRLGSVVLPCFPATCRINKCQALEVCFAKLNIDLSGCAFTGRSDNLGENRFRSYNLVYLHFALACLIDIESNYLLEKIT